MCPGVGLVRCATFIVSVQAVIVAPAGMPARLNAITVR